MAENWDYAQLSSMAKEAGGPEEYLKAVKDAAYEEGQESMESICGLFFLAGACTFYLGYKGYNHLKKRKMIKVNAADAERKLIDGINEYDANNIESEVTLCDVSTVKYEED